MRKLKRLAMATGALVLAGLALTAILVMAMSSTPSTTCMSDEQQIEAVIREYYDAFNCYDVDRVEDTLAEQTTERAREAMLRTVVWAESVGFERHMESMVSVWIDGDFALATVEGGAEWDTWPLVRKGGCWKIWMPIEGI